MEKIIISIIKIIYMFLFHPIIFWTQSRKNGLFMLWGADLRHLTKMNLGKNIRFGYGTRMNFYDGNREKKLFIGDNCFIGNRNTFLLGERITLEKDVLIASDVLITSENHSMDPVSEIPYKDQPLQMKPVFVGEGTWISEKVVILPGVSIGKKCIIGAGAIVTKDIPDYCIAAGNPARVIKKFDFLDNKWKNIE